MRFLVTYRITIWRFQRNGRDVLGTVRYAVGEQERDALVERYENRSNVYTVDVETVNNG